MTHYVAIVEDAGPDVAVGLWFPDLPGCFSAGDSVEEAMENAREAISAYAEARASEGNPLPVPRRLAAIKADPAWSADFDRYLVALVEAPRAREAA
ncbi:MAG: type II toxin-antitoxin system HicB family antitoxin [Bauldia sp.]|nr:type II toxin-antitoxin system HicB family antitoxin [Bauldia sp.]